MKMSIVTVELTEAQAAELDAAKDNPDTVETILARIAAEVEAKEKVREMTGREVALDALRDMAARIRGELTRDVLLCAHHLMHEKRNEEALSMLCPMAALIEGEKLPRDTMTALMRKVDEISVERHKSECEGSA